MKEKHNSKQSKSGNKIQTAKENPNTERLKFVLAVVAMLLLTFIVYLPVLKNELLIWDDKAYILNNSLIQSFDLKAIFTKNVLGNYHPFTILMFATEYHFFGTNAAGYHGVKLFLHLANTILVGYVILQLSNKPGIALVAALLFGIHPLHVESVAWAAELKDLLYTCFFLLSFIAYLKYQHTKRSGFYVMAFLFFASAVLSKAMAVTLPLVFILTDYFNGRKFDLRAWLEKVPFLLLASIAGVIAIRMQHASDAFQVFTLFTFPQRIAFACYGFCMYLFKLLLPFQLCAFYPYPVDAGSAIPIYYYAFIPLTLGLFAYTIYTIRRTGKIVFGMGFFTITVLLVLKLLPVGDAIMADRYAYVPSIGIFYLAGEGIYWLWMRNAKVLAGVLIGILAIFFSVKTYSQCQVWRSDLTLWNDVIEQYQTIPQAYNNRGIARSNDKKYEEALEDFNMAITLSPSYADLYLNRGDTYQELKKTEEAINDFTTTLKLNPDCIKAYYNRGTLYAITKRNKEAYDDLHKTIELDPGHVKAYYRLGGLYSEEANYAAAIEQYSKAIELKKDFAKAYFYRALAKYYTGKKMEGCKDLKLAESYGFQPPADALHMICD